MFVQGVYKRFLSIVLPVSILVFVALIGTFERAAFQQAEDKLNEKLNTSINIYSLLLAEPLALGETDKIDLFMSYLLSDQDIASLVIMNTNNDVVESFGVASSVKPSLSKQQAIRYADESGLRTVGRLYIGMNTQHIIEDLEQRVFYAIILLIALVIAVIISTRIAYRSSIGRPLKLLTEAIKKYEESGVHERVPSHGRDELGAVIYAYNKMQKLQVIAKDETEQQKQDFKKHINEQEQSLHKALSRHYKTANHLFSSLTNNLRERSNLANNKHGLCHLKLSNFNRLIENCGMEMAQQRLLQVSDLINVHIQPSDNLIALENAEFGLLLENSEESKTLTLAQDISNATKMLCQSWKGCDVTIDIHIGVTTISTDSPGYKQLLDQADNACKNAVSQHTGVLVYQEG